MPTAIDMIGQHIAAEEYAARTYRYLQSWCGLNGYPGCEAYFAAESADELKHMAAFQAYWDDRADTVTPRDIDPQGTIEGGYSRLVDLFSDAMELEKDVLGQLNAIGAQAVAESNFDVLRFLQPFTEVGVASIRELTTFVQQLNRAGNDPAALLVFDSEIGEEG